MKILILSDAHRADYNTIQAIEREPEAEVVYFLGDGVTNVKELSLNYCDKKAFILIKGNCDLYADFPEFDVRAFEGVKIYACHGHKERVKYGYGGLIQKLYGNKCTIGLFGHTHEQYEEYDNGIYIFNPGSIRDGNYGVLDIKNGNILFTKKKLIY